MKRLIYHSFAAPQLKADDVFGIVERASAWNGSVGLSGFLLFREREFMQLLEGDADALDELFEKVRVDPRHRSIEVKFENAIESRCFSRWRMQRIAVTSPHVARDMLRRNQDEPLPARESAIVESFLKGEAGRQQAGAAA